MASISIEISDSLERPDLVVLRPDAAQLDLTQKSHRLALKILARLVRDRRDVRVEIPEGWMGAE